MKRILIVNRVSNPYINLVCKLAQRFRNLAHLVCPVKSALLPVYPMPGAVDLSDGRDPPIPLFQYVGNESKVAFNSSREEE